MSQAVLPATRAQKSGSIVCISSVSAQRGERGGFVGMPGFGASGPAEALFEHFGITVEAIVAEVRRCLLLRR